MQQTDALNSLRIPLSKLTITGASSECSTAFASPHRADPSTWMCLIPKVASFGSVAWPGWGEEVTVVSGYCDLCS